MAGFGLDAIAPAGLASWADARTAFTRLADNLQNRFTEAELLSGRNVELQAKVDRLEADLADGMKSVKEMVKEIENRSKMIEAAVANGDSNMVKGDGKGGNGKIDAREIPSWDGPQSMEFPEFA